MATASVQIESGGRGERLQVLESRGCFLATCRSPGIGPVEATDTVLLLWAPVAGTVRVPSASVHTLAPGDYALCAPDDPVELRPAADDPGGRVHALGVDTRLLVEIGGELAAVSRATIELDGLLRSLQEQFYVERQPDWLVGLLADLDQAGMLGLQDGAWLRRHVRLVWERLIFSQAARRQTQARRPSRPRPHSRRNGLTLRLRRVRRLMEREYHRPLDLAEMAAIACVSRYHFLREFRKAYGRTPYQLLLDIRLQAAERMLKGGDLPVQEIGRQVGFASTDGFYRAFRRRYQRSPTDYRATG